MLAQACGLRHSSDLSDSRRNPQLPSTPSADQSHQRSGSGAPALDLIDTRNRGLIDNSAHEYDLDRPAQSWSLPNVLKEISDIAVLSDSEVACVQDERGIVFVYNMTLKRITDEVRFAARGDYEGLAIAGSQLYVLRSDSVLFELSSLKHHPSVRKFELHLPFAECEGLCLDAAHNRLLIAPKSYEHTASGKDARPIYAFDLDQKVASPAFQISVREIRHFAKHHDLPVPRRPKKDGENMHSVLRFMPSAIAVHPVTAEVYLLSSVDHVLVSCSEAGTVTGYAVLDAALFRQPEGIAFFPNGDMLISSEAAGKDAKLVLIRWQRNQSNSPARRPPLTSSGDETLHH